MATNYFHPADQGAAFAGANISVFWDFVKTDNDGTPSWQSWNFPTENLVPLSMQWNSNGQPSTLSLQYAIKESEPDTRAGEEKLTHAGDRIRVVQNIGFGRTREIFRGYIGLAGFGIQAGPDVETIQVTAYGPEVLLDCNVAKGVYYFTPTFEDTIVGGATFTVTDDDMEWFDGDVTFNLNGKANCSGEDSNDKYFFVPPEHIIKATNGDAKLTAEYWTAYSAAHWIVENLFSVPAAGVSISSTLGAHQTALTAAPLSETQITGKPATEALALVLRQAGYGYTISPWTIGGAYKLWIFPLRASTSVPGPWLRDRADLVSIASVAGRKTQVQRLGFVRDAHNARNDITVIGDYRREMITLVWDGDSTDDLQPFWDTTEDDIGDYDTSNTIELGMNSARTTFLAGYTFNVSGANKHAFRSWALNEDGKLAPTITNIPDLATLGEEPVDCGDSDGHMYRRPRPIKPMWLYTDGTHTKFHPAYVEIGIVGNASSWIGVKADIWKDRCGFTITHNALATKDGFWYPWAKAAATGTEDYADLKDVSYLQALYNTLNAVGSNELRVRIIGAIETDDRVLGEASYRQSSAWPFKSQQVIYAPQRFVKRGNTAPEGLAGGYGNDDRDDSTLAETYAEDVRGILEDALGHGSIILRGINRNYRPGQGISKTRGWERNLAIGGGEDSKYYPVISSMVFDFREGMQKTELVLDTPVARVMR